MEAKLLGALSLCRKAGKLRLGADVVKEEIAAGHAVLVLLAPDLSPRSQKQARIACEQGRVDVLELPYTMEQLAHVIGKHAGILAICDAGFARMMKGLLAGTP